MHGVLAALLRKWLSSLSFFCLFYTFSFFITTLRLLKSKYIMFRRSILIKQVRVIALQIKKKTCFVLGLPLFRYFFCPTFVLFEFAGGFLGDGWGGGWSACRLWNWLLLRGCRVPQRQHKTVPTSSRSVHAMHANWANDIDGFIIKMNCAQKDDHFQTG